MHCFAPESGKRDHASRPSTGVLPRWTTAVDAAQHVCAGQTHSHEGEPYAQADVPALEHFAKPSLLRAFASASPQTIRKGRMPSRPRRHWTWNLKITATRMIGMIVVQAMCWPMSRWPGCQVLLPGRLSSRAQLYKSVRRRQCRSAAAVQEALRHQPLSQAGSHGWGVCSSCNCHCEWMPILRRAPTARYCSCLLVLATVAGRH